MATIYDVAKEAGVSHTTVARVLANHVNVSERTSRKVNAAIKKLNYRKMDAAANLANAGKCLLGILTPDTEVDFYNLYRAGAHKAFDELASQGIRVAFYTYTHNRNSGRNEECLKQIREDRPQGLILMPDSPIRPEELKAAAPDVTIVALEDAAMSLNLGANQKEVGRLAASLFTHRSGDSTTAIIADDCLPAIADRIAAFREVLVQAPGHTVELHIKADEETWGELTAKALAANPNITGVFVPHMSGDEVADVVVRRGRKPQILVVTMDFTPENARALAAGAIDYIIHTQPEQEAYEAVYGLWRMIRTKSPFQAFPIPPMVLAAATIKSFKTYLAAKYDYTTD